MHDFPLICWAKREEENRSAKKHLAARRGVGSEEYGIHLAGNYHHGATQDPVENFHRWPMLPARSIDGHK